MRKNQPLPVNTLLKNNNEKDNLLLKTLQQQATVLAQLNKFVLDKLPQQLCDVCRVANYKKNSLIIEVASASWLTRLRYEQDKLLTEIRQNILPNVANIQFSINPELSKNKMVLRNPSMKPRIMTTASADILSALAENSPDGLKQQLMKLAKHAKKHN